MTERLWRLRFTLADRLYPLQPIIDHAVREGYDLGHAVGKGEADAGQWHSGYVDGFHAGYATATRGRRDG